MNDIELLLNGNNEKEQRIERFFDILEHILLTSSDDEVFLLPISFG